MSAAVVALALAVVVWRLWARRARADRLAGLDGDKPAFMVSPPTRRVGRRQTERL